MSRILRAGLLLAGVVAGAGMWPVRAGADGGSLRKATESPVTVSGGILRRPPEGLSLGRFEYAVATASPRVDAVLYPIPLQQDGRTWSQWGDGLLAGDGRFYSAIGDHGGPGGRSYVYAYDPEARRLELVFDQQALLGQQPGDWGFGKIHCRLEELPDGRILWGTYWGTAPPEDWRQEAELYGMVVAADPRTGAFEVLGVLEAPYVIPAAVADTRRGLFYALPCDRGWQGRGFAVFDVARRRTIYRGQVDTEVGRRFVFVDETDGSAWFSVRPDGPGGPVWLARYDAAANTVEERGIRLPDGYGPVRAGTEHRDGQGLFYGVCEGRLVRVDPVARTAEPLGLVWPEHPAARGEGAAGTGAYTTVLEISPGGRYLYALPGAHGHAWRHGAPVVQVDLRTGARKVLAFLGPEFETQHRYRVGGSYALELSADGSRLFFGTNGVLLEDDRPPPASAFGHPASMVLHIPARERPDDEP